MAGRGGEVFRLPEKAVGAVMSGRSGGNFAAENVVKRDDLRADRRFGGGQRLGIGGQFDGRRGRFAAFGRRGRFGNGSGVFVFRQ